MASRLFSPAVIAGVVLLALATMILAPVLANRTTDGSQSELVNDVEPFAYSLSRAERDLFALSAAVRGFAITHDVDELHLYAEARSALDAEHAALSGYAARAGYEPEAARLIQLAEDYVTVTDAVIAAVVAGREQDVSQLAGGPGAEALAAYRAPANDLHAAVLAEIEDLRRTIKRAQDREQLVTLVAGGFGVLATFSLVWLMYANLRLTRRLKSQSARVDGIIDDVPGVVWEAWGAPDATHQRIDFVSHQIEPMTGYTREEWLNTPNFWLTIVHPDDRQRAGDEAARIFESGDGGVSEFRWVARGGRVFWVAAYSSVILDESGKPAGMRGVTLDVNDAKLAMEARAFSNEVTRRLTSSLNAERALAALADLCVPRLADWCAVHLIDDDGEARMTSLAHSDPKKVDLVRDLGERYPPDRDSGTGVYQVLRTGNAEMAEISDAALVASARDADHLRILRELGLRSYVSVALKARGKVLGAITLVASESGRSYGADDLALAEEIAARAAIAVDNSLLYREAQLERARFGSMVNAVDYGVVALDGACRIDYVNPVGERMFGATMAELQGRAFDDMIDLGSENGQDAAAFATALHEWTAYEGRVLLRRRDGEVFATAVNLSFLSTQPRVGGAVIAFQDITDRLREEQAKDDFLAFASHELRSPLTSVVGMSKWLASRTAARPDDFDEDLRDAIETLEREADRTASIVELFLDLSRIEAGRLQVDPETVDIASLLREQSEGLHRRYPHAGITVNGVEEPCVIVTDPVRVEQALTNLLDNAAKYGGDAPAVTLTLDRSSGGGAVISVRDRGPGITVEEQAHVFNRRYRGSAAKGGRGLGVGLFITREILEALGGTLTLISRQGEGAEFVMALPARSKRRA